nr:PD-(D/E)XK nuclease family protein [Parvibaculum indicum]
METRHTATSGIGDAFRGREEHLVSLRVFLERVAVARKAGEIQTLARKPVTSPIDGDRLALLLTMLGARVREARESGAFIDVWEVAGLRRDEVRHAAVLAWLLDAKGSHGLGAAVLQEWIGILADRHGGAFPLSLDMHVAPYTIFTENCPFGAADNRVDIALDGGNSTVFIEVKIDAPEGPDQIRRYLDLAWEKSVKSGKDEYAVIFLSPSRPMPTVPDSENVVVASWNTVAEAIRKVVRSRAGGVEGTRTVLQFAERVARF